MREDCTAYLKRSVNRNAEEETALGSDEAQTYLIQREETTSRYGGGHAGRRDGCSLYTEEKRSTMTCRTEGTIGFVRQSTWTIIEAQFWWV